MTRSQDPFTRSCLLILQLVRLILLITLALLSFMLTLITVGMFHLQSDISSMLRRLSISYLRSTNRLSHNASELRMSPISEHFCTFVLMKCVGAIFLCRSMVLDHLRRSQSRQKY